jgi:AAA+ superfamily predicted ATPase
MPEDHTEETKSYSPLVRFWRWLTGADRPSPIYTHFERFFANDLTKLEAHQKLFPGYDLASISLALRSLLDECTTQSQELGATRFFNIEDLLNNFKIPMGRFELAGPLGFQRVAIDVDHEESVVCRGLWLSQLKSQTGANLVRRSAKLNAESPPAADSRPSESEKIAILFGTYASHDYWEDMSTNQGPSAQISISVACRRREVADRFFAELEARRRKLCVYRGKVIEPVVMGKSIFSIAFRAVKRVREEDLVLSEEVRNLLQSSVVGFYRHAPLLEELGIEMKRGLLLHGPPGTGKTSVSLYLAGLLQGFTVCFVSGDRLLHPREVCRMARYLQPSMVVFEDIDLVAAERDSNGLATVLGELMNQIDGCEPTEQVLFVMNTNSLERLETAVKNRPGRVDQILEVPLPDRTARRKLLEMFARRLTLPEGELVAVLDAMREMSPAMIKEVVKRSVVIALERTKGETTKLIEEDLLQAVEQVQLMRDKVASPGALGFRRSDEQP